MITKFDIFGLTDKYYLMLYAEQYVKKYYYPDGLQGLYSYADIKKRIKKFCKTNFPKGLNNLKNPLTLYRLLNVESEKDINKKNLGRHCVGDKKLFYDEDFLTSASILHGNDPIKTFFLVTLETPLENLDIDNILGNRAEYPSEYEFTLINDSDLKILNVEELDEDFYLQ